MARAETTEILADLIGFPTVSSDSNLALIDYARQRLERLGARCHLTRDETGGKANLFATLGPDGDGGIVLSGHTDVVPADPDDWTVDPFQATERDGRIHGRGACDMKGFLACALAAAPRFAAADLRRPVHFALTYDEETGCLGAPVMLEALARTGPRPALCVIGEPTSMRIIEGHKGCYEYTTTFTGLEGHGSEPDKGVNAVEYAARFICHLLEVAEAMRARAPADSRFEPPWTTLQTGLVRGGMARNVIARECAVEWEMRPVTRDDAEEAWRRIRAHVTDDLLARMRAGSAEADIVTRVIGEVDGLEPMEHNAALDLVRELTGGNTVDVVAFGTEAGLYQKAGIETVICGPGSIEQAHKPDEYVSVEQLAACERMLDRLIPKLETRS